MNVNDFQTSGDLLDHLTAAAREQGKDRFFSYLTTRTEDNSLLGEGQFNGFGFRNRIDPGDRVFVLEVFESSPAGEAGLRRGDEIGALASSFNQMAVDLSQHRKHLNELVDARTAELRDTNVRLETEVAERRRVEDELRQSREELRRLASHLESVREQERTEIAREIHDELGQALTALKMDLHWVGQRVGDERASVGAKISALSKAIDATTGI